MSDDNVISSFFNVGGQESGDDVYDEGMIFMIGQVHKVHFIDDQTSISKSFVEYDVNVRDAYGAQTTYRNVRSLASFFGGNDYEETVFEPNAFASKGKLEPGNLPSNMNGAIVVLGHLHGSKDKPFIIGSFPHTIKGATKKDGIRKKGEYRGFEWEINKDGDFEVTFNGAKKPDGKPANEKLSKTTIKIGKDGKVKTTTGHQITFVNEKNKEQIQILTAGKQLFQFSDIPGSESIALVHKSGALFNIDKKGSVKLAAANGSYLFLDSETGDVSLTQADGNVFSVGSQSTLGSSDGKRMFSVLGSAIQAVSDKDLLIQSGGKTSIDAGSIIMKDPIGATVKVANGQIAIGTSAAELLDLVNQLLTQLGNLCTALSSETHIGNLGYPTSPPVNAAAYAAVQAQITVIQTLLTTIKGSV